MATILKIGHSMFEADAATAAGFIKLIDGGHMKPVSHNWREGGYERLTDEDESKVEILMGQKVRDKAPPPPPEPAPEPEALCITESQKVLEHAGPTEDIPS